MPLRNRVEHHSCRACRMWAACLVGRAGGGPVPVPVPVPGATPRDGATPVQAVARPSRPPAG
eukprot:1471226-Pyramimonas_sp.AAC.1